MSVCVGRRFVRASQLNNRGMVMMSLIVVAAIVVSIALGYKTKINTGFFAIAFAYAIGRRSSCASLPEFMLLPR